MIKFIFSRTLVTGAMILAIGVYPVMGATCAVSCGETGGLGTHSCMQASAPAYTSAHDCCIGEASGDVQAPFRKATLVRRDTPLPDFSVRLSVMAREEAVLTAGTLPVPEISKNAFLTTSLFVLHAAFLI